MFCPIVMAWITLRHSPQILVRIKLVNDLMPQYPLKHVLQADDTNRLAKLIHHDEQVMPHSQKRRQRVLQCLILADVIHLFLHDGSCPLARRRTVNCQ